MTPPRNLAEDLGAPDSPQSNLIDRLRRLRPYFGNQRGTWALVGLGAVVGAATEPMIPYLMGILLDQGFQKGNLAIWTVPASVIALFGVRGVAGYISQIGLTKITSQGLVHLRSQMFNKLLVSELDLFSRQTASSLSNTLVYEVQNGAGMLVNSGLSLVRNGLAAFALVASLFYQNWKLTLIVAAVFPAVAIVMRILTRRVHQLTKANQAATDGLAYVVEENVLAHREIRLYGAQQSQSERFGSLNVALQRLAVKSTVAAAAMTPLTQMLAAVGLSAVISIALLQSAHSNTSVGGFVAFVTNMLLIIAPIRQLSEISGPITRGLVALERALALIHNEPSERSGAFNKARALGHIAFNDVSVTYPGASNPAVTNLSMEISPGETVALVGSSGSGKTTLMNLLPRFIEVSHGTISLDGVDLTEWDLNSLRSQFAVVSQNVVMLNASIANNVTLGLPMDRSKVESCLKAANLWQFVGTLASSIDHFVGHNATQLSGGQRQRLAIARALYKDAPILILDEATSALDTESERAVQDALQVLMLGRTTLVIAHRLSTVAHATRIVVMDKGCISEVGSHSHLLERDGAYAKLFRLGYDNTGLLN